MVNPMDRLDDLSHGTTCAQRFHGTAECDCWKARVAEDLDRAAWDGQRGGIVEVRDGAGERIEAFAVLGADIPREGVPARLRGTQ